MNHNVTCCELLNQLFLLHLSTLYRLKCIHAHNVPLQFAIQCTLAILFIFHEADIFTPSTPKNALLFHAVYNSNDWIVLDDSKWGSTG